ncbi:MAG: pyridoxal-phosphate dependent enzyme [Myxococcales bacterium]|nr:pyridoxal-phosphate dependent enzyme [Myxococcota bacterium]MDW8281807.1 pyridoxal-phosphate dependent enzyme [Myxococcales bacterium]
MHPALPPLPRLSLAQLPTPAMPLRRLLPALLPGAPVPELWVKRDDLTGAALSGNKVRKLELLLAEAVARGADTVITCGGLQSNHCRATALAAAQLGLRSVLLLRTADPTAPPPLEGNVLLDRLAGAELRLVSPAQYRDRASLLSALRQELAQAGRSAYLIPEGGSNALGALAYARCVAELQAQLPPGPWTLCCAVGSGGTLAGLLLGVALAGLPWRVVGFAVCDDRAHFVRIVGELLDEIARRFQLPQAAELARRQDAIELRDHSVGRGYALSRPQELAVLRDACRLEGLVLDPVYTGKALHGLVEELRQDPASLGPRLLFVHTGGLFGLFPRGAELAPLLD